MITEMQSTPLQLHYYTYSCSVCSGFRLVGFPKENGDTKRKLSLRQGSETCLFEDSTRTVQKLALFIAYTIATLRSYCTVGTVLYNTSNLLP
jgi:hypothetical protein